MVLLLLTSVIFGLMAYNLTMRPVPNSTSKTCGSMGRSGAIPHCPTGDVLSYVSFAAFNHLYNDVLASES